MLRFMPLALAAALLAGCATTSPRAGPVDVTRFHLGPPALASVRVEPLTAYAGVSPQDGTYVGAVSDELARLGFAPTAGDAAPTYLAQVAYKRIPRGTVRKRAPVTIGLGGGSYGGGVGVGGGASFGIGGGSAQLVETELSVQLKRRSDNTIVWEGRAITQALNEKDEPVTTPQRLAAALFKGFPGESGITITVK